MGIDQKVVFIWRLTATIFRNVHVPVQIDYNHHCLSHCEVSFLLWTSLVLLFLNVETVICVFTAPPLLLGTDITCRKNICHCSVTVKHVWMIVFLLNESLVLDDFVCPSTLRIKKQQNTVRLEVSKILAFWTCGISSPDTTSSEFLLWSAADLAAWSDIYLRFLQICFKVNYP